MKSLLIVLLIYNYLCLLASRQSCFQRVSIKFSAFSINYPTNSPQGIQKGIKINTNQPSNHRIATKSFATSFNDVNRPFLSPPENNETFFFSILHEVNTIRRCMMSFSNWLQWHAHLFILHQRLIEMIFIGVDQKCAMVIGIRLT